MKAAEVSSTLPVKNSTDVADNNMSSAMVMPKDINSISELSKYLSDAKVDITSSTASLNGADINFDLTFKKSETESLQASGFYNTTTQDYEFKINYSFKKYVLENGVMKAVPFGAQFNVSSQDSTTNDSSSTSSAIDESSQRSEIYRYLANVISRIFETSPEKMQSLSGASLTSEDLISLAQIGDAKTAKMVRELINAAIFTAELKELVKNKAKTQDDTSASSTLQTAVSSINENNTLPSADITAQIVRKTDQTENTSENASQK